MAGSQAVSFSWFVASVDSTTTLSLRGELDLAAVLATKDALVEEVERSDGKVIVDATELDFIDSTGIRLLLDLKFRLDRTYRSFMVGAVSAPVARVLDVSGVWPVFDKAQANESTKL